MQQLAHLHHPSAVGQAIGQHRVVAAEGQVHAPYLAAPLTEPRLAGEHERHVFVRRTPAPVLDEPAAGGPVFTRRVQFARPTAGEGDEVAGVSRQRQGDGERVDEVASGRQVGERALHGEHVVQADAGVEAHFGHGVDGAHHHPVGDGLHTGGHESRRPSRATTAMCQQTRPPSETRGMFGHHTDRCHHVESAEHHGARQRGREGRHIDVAQWRTPIHDGGHT